MSIAKRIAALIVSVAAVAAILIALPASLSATASIIPGASLRYTFNSAGTLRQAASAGKSTSPYWWLASGAQLIIKNGIGETIQGAQPSGTSGVSSDNGTHPQNMFLMFSRESAQNASAQIYVKRVVDNLGNAANRQPYIGESLIARYQDSNTYYYAGIRADGSVVIKKKTDGVFQTLATATLFPGTYSATSAPDLIPLGKWIGLKFAVVNSASGIPQLSLYTDVGETGAWKLALSVADDPSKYGAAITGSGLVGIESDYADAQFDNFLLAPLSAPTSASSSSASSTSLTLPPTTPLTTSPLLPVATTSTSSVSSTSGSYDSVVLADKPALYLAMSSPASGAEKDESGNGLNGTYKGGTPALVKLPNGDSAADFNGTSEYLTVPSNAALSIPETGELTWEGWIRPDTFNFSDESSDGYVDWMGKCEDYSPSCEWEARIYGSATSQGRPDRLSAYVFNPSAGLGSAADWQPAGNLQAGQWLYVVAEYQTQTTPSGCSSTYPGTITIWVNGVEQNFADHAPTGCMSQYKVTPKASDSPLDIGTMALDTFFKGAVGKVAIYDHLLTQEQIDEHYQAMTGFNVSGSCGITCAIPLLNLL